MNAFLRARTTFGCEYLISFLSLPHWIQHTSIRDENRDFRKSGKPPVKTGRNLSAFRYMANLICSSK